MKRGGPLRSDPDKQRDWRRRSKPLKRSGSKRRRPVSPASPAQREKVAGAVSIVSGKSGCHPAHILPRSLGGCDDRLCVVPLTPDEHRAYDNGDLDLLPYLVRARCIPELQHAIGHTGSLVSLLERVTNRRWAPVEGER